MNWNRERRHSSRQGGGRAGRLAGPNEQYYFYGGNLEPRNFEGSPEGYQRNLGMPNYSSDRLTGDEYHGWSEEGRNSRRMTGMNLPANERSGFENFDYMEPGYNDYNARGAEQETYGGYWKESGVGPSAIDMKHGYTGPHHGAPPHHWQDENEMMRGGMRGGQGFPQQGYPQQGGFQGMQGHYGPQQYQGPQGYQGQRHPGMPGQGRIMNPQGGMLPYGVEMHYHDYGQEDHGYYDEFGRGIGTMRYQPYYPNQGQPPQGRNRQRRRM